MTLEEMMVMHMPVDCREKAAELAVKVHAGELTLREAMKQLQESIVLPEEEPTEWTRRNEQ